MRPIRIKMICMLLIVLVAAGCSTTTKRPLYTDTLLYMCGGTYVTLRVAPGDPTSNELYVFTRYGSEFAFMLYTTDTHRLSFHTPERGWVNYYLQPNDMESANKAAHAFYAYVKERYGTKALPCTIACLTLIEMRSNPKRAQQWPHPS